MTDTMTSAPDVSARDVAAALELARAKLRELDDAIAAQRADVDRRSREAAAAAADAFVVGDPGHGPRAAAALDDAESVLAGLNGDRARTATAIAELEERHTAALEREALDEQEGLARRWANRSARMVELVDELVDAGRELWRLADRDDAIAARRARDAGIEGSWTPGYAHRRLGYQAERPPVLPLLEQLARHVHGLQLTTPPASADTTTEG